MIIHTGMEGTASRLITEKETAKTVGSGTLDVCATPVVCALMEAAAVDALAGCLPAGTTTVGSYIAAMHKAPTLTGRTVTAKATLVETEGRKLIFHITASDEAGEVAEAEHVRYLIDSEPFMDKAAKRYR